MTIEIIPAPTSAPASVATPMARCRNRSSGSTGSGARRSASRKTIKETAAIGSPTALARPPWTPTSNAVSPTVRSPAPAQSNECGRRSTFSWSAPTSSAAAAMPAGTLMKNTQRQERYLTMMPPSSGPISPATPHTAPKTPCIRERSSRL